MRTRTLGALLAAGLAGIAPARALSQQMGSTCAMPVDSTIVTAPSIALDTDLNAHYLVGDSIRIGVSLNNAPPGARATFAIAGIERAVIDAGNVLRWRPTRGMEGANYFTLSASIGAATLACRQVRVLVDRAQRAPILRISSKQVQAGATLEFLIGAVDPDGDSLSYSVSEMTAGVTTPTIDSTGRFRWRTPVSVSSVGRPYVFKVEVSDGLDISTAIFAVAVSGQNVRPECPVTAASVTATEGSSVVVPMNASDQNGDALRYRAERDLINGRVDSAGYRWDVPWQTVDNGTGERVVSFQWRAIDAHEAQSDVCSTAITVRARMEPDRLRAEQAAHARFLSDAIATSQQLDSRLKGIRDRINASDRARHRRSIVALATALLAGGFQLAGAEDTRRLAGGINTLTSVFFAGFSTLAPGTDALKSDARRYEDQIAKYAPMISSFRVNYGETVSENAIRASQYRADRQGLEAEQARASVLMTR